MKYLSIIISTLIFTTILPAFTKNEPDITVVYPKNNATINAPSTFFVGSTEPKSQLTINSNKVRVYPNGGFTEIVSLQRGTNTIRLKSTLKDKTNEVTYTINVPEAEKIVPNYSPEADKITNITAIAEVIKAKATVRTAPGKSRLTPLPLGAKINITGKLGNDYRFELSDVANGWISGDDIRILPEGTPVAKSVVSAINVVNTPENIFINIPLSTKLPLSINEPSESEINFSIYKAVADVNLIPYGKNNDFIKEIKWNQPSEDTFQLNINTNPKQLWGYDYYYEDNTLVIKLKKPPLITKINPLKGKIITIDAGHGGSEPGSVGPTGIPEKEINLAIAKYLEKELKSNGVKVIMTRNNNSSNPDLYERVNIADKTNSDILVSIHNNALPDGRDPYKEHGSSTYYYHSHSLPLARDIQKAMVRDLGLNDYGIFWDSLALTRPAQFPAVLIEVGFMINPDEYMLLTEKSFQKKAARAISEGLKEFFRNSGSN